MLANWQNDPRVIDYRASTPTWSGEFAHLPDALRNALDGGSPAPSPTYTPAPAPAPWDGSDWRQHPDVIAYSYTNPRWSGEFSHLPDALRNRIDPPTRAPSGGGYTPTNTPPIPSSPTPVATSLPDGWYGNKTDGSSVYEVRGGVKAHAPNQSELERVGGAGIWGRIQWVPWSQLQGIREVAWPISSASPSPSVPAGPNTNPAPYNPPSVPNTPAGKWTDNSGGGGSYTPAPAAPVVAGIPNEYLMIGGMMFLLLVVAMMKS